MLLGFIGVVLAVAGWVLLKRPQEQALAKLQVCGFPLLFTINLLGPCSQNMLFCCIRFIVT